MLIESPFVRGATRTLRCPDAALPLEDALSSG
jgi:hypothetical protein